MQFEIWSEADLDSQVAMAQMSQWNQSKAKDAMRKLDYWIEQFNQANFTRFIEQIAMRYDAI